MAGGSREQIVEPRFLLWKRSSASAQLSLVSALFDEFKLTKILMQPSIYNITKAQLSLNGLLVHPEPIRLQDELLSFVSLHVNSDISVADMLKQGFTGTLKLSKG